MNIWYHGSDQRFDILLEGSTITQRRELAEAFSHKPSMLCIEDDGTITHNGNKSGVLYVIDEAIILGQDVIPHPRSAMEPGMEWITTRPLKVKMLAKLPR